MINVAIFASGEGTNAENLFNYFANDSRIKIKLVVTNKDDAGIILRAAKYNKNVQILSKSALQNYSNQFIEFLKVEHIDLIVLAGFLLKIPIEFIAPTFVVQSSEKVYGNLGTSATLSSSIQAELIKKGLKLGAADRADYVIQISANSTEGGTSQGFVVAFLEMSITITNRAGDKVFQESINNIKGLQLNKDAASIEAYKKGKQRIEEQMISSILESIF
jgi:hydroxymethylpyrimidine/phosphomethylpyrimidine kinase